MKYLFLLLIVCFNVSFAQPQKHVWTGTASYYHTKFNGRKTFSGERFDNRKLTAANNFLPIGSRVKVTNLRNNKSVVVTVNDRMNARNRRLIDLSAEAAKQLGFYNKGLCKVRVEQLSSSKKDHGSQDTLSEKTIHKKRAKSLNKR